MTNHFQFCVIGYCPCGTVCCLTAPTDFVTTCVMQRYLVAQHPGKPITFGIVLNNRMARAQRAEILKRPTTKLFPGQVVTSIKAVPGKLPEITTGPIQPPAAAAEDEAAS